MSRPSKSTRQMHAAKSEKVGHVFHSDCGSARTGSSRASCGETSAKKEAKRIRRRLQQSRSAMKCRQRRQLELENTKMKYEENSKRIEDLERIAQVLTYELSLPSTGRSEKGFNTRYFREKSMSSSEDPHSAKRPDWYGDPF